jgi:hypothetical protein
MQDKSLSLKTKGLAVFLNSSGPFNSTEIYLFYRWQHEFRFIHTPNNDNVTPVLFNREHKIITNVIKTKGLPQVIKKITLPYFSGLKFTNRAFCF